MGPYDLIVVGGGVVGSAVAYGAARRGAHVAVLDGSDDAIRSSRVNFGLVWVQGKGAKLPPYAAWTRRSSELWPQLARELRERTEVDCCLEQPGGMSFCLTEAELEAAAARARHMHATCGDEDTVILSRAETKARVPEIGPQVVGASFNRRDGHVSPLYTLRALQAGLQALGGDYLPGRTVEAIVHDGGFTVHAGAEAFRGARLVIAAGHGARALAPLVGLSMPVAPERGEIVVTERLRRFYHYTGDILRQTAEGTMMIGDSHENVGFDTSVSVPVLGGIARRAVAIFPALAEATVVRTWSGLRVLSPDSLPIYDESRTCPGAFAVTCHSGVTLAAAHALALAPLLLSGSLPETFHAFSADRFRVPAA